jgi:predicted secreted protein
MASIVIYPENEKQISLLKMLLDELKVRFEINKEKDDTLLSKEEFYAKIDDSIKQSKEGKTIRISSKNQKAFLGL